MLFNLTDPRLGSDVYPKNNIIIEQAQVEVRNPTESGLLDDLLKSSLEKSQDGTINIAVNLAPSLIVANYIWDRLNIVLEQANSRILAIPVIIVSGSQESKHLSFQISVDKIKDIFTGMFGTINYIHSSLISVNQLSQFTPSWVHSKQAYLDKIVIENNVSHIGENVYLRFMLLDVEQPNDSYRSIYQNTKMSLMNILLDDIKQDGLTNFVIPDELLSLNKAYLSGNLLYQEISLSIALSNLTKKIRMQGNTPKVEVTTDGVNSIILKVFNSAEYMVTLKWELAILDDFMYVCSKLDELFSDLQLEVINVSQ